MNFIYIYNPVPFGQQPPPRLPGASLRWGSFSRCNDLTVRPSTRATADPNMGRGGKGLGRTKGWGDGCVKIIFISINIIITCPTNKIYAHILSAMGHCRPMP